MLHCTCCNQKSSAISLERNSVNISLFKTSVMPTYAILALVIKTDCNEHSMTYISYVLFSWKQHGCCRCFILPMIVARILITGIGVVAYRMQCPPHAGSGEYFLMHEYLCSVSLGLLYISPAVWFLFSQYQPRDWLGRAPPKWPILCRVGCKTLSQSMQYSFHLEQVDEVQWMISLVDGSPSSLLWCFDSFCWVTGNYSCLMAIFSGEPGSAVFRLGRPPQPVLKRLRISGMGFLRARWPACQSTEGNTKHWP